MPWPAIAITLLISIIVLHLWWRKKYRELLQEKWHLERREEELESLCDSIKSEAKTQRNALFDSMIEGVLLVDSQSCIQHANHSFLKLFNQTKELVQGKTIMESVRIHELEAIIHFLEHKNQVMGTEISVPGQQDLLLEVNAVATKDEKNKPTGYIMVFHDLTNIRRL